MTWSLVRKELRELLPWAILSFCVGFVDLVWLLLRPFDMLPLSATHELLGEQNGVVLWFMAFAIGTGLGPREQDDGTLAFLDGLPVARTRVFLVKIAVTLVLLSFAPLVVTSSALAAHALSHGSLDASYRWDIVLGSLGLQFAALVSGLCLGTALGWLRSFTWLVAAAGAVLLMVLVKEVPRAELLNPLALLDPTITSAGLFLSGEVLYSQLGLSALGLVVSWRMFLRAGRPTEWLDLSARPVASAIVTSLTVGAVVAGSVVAFSDLEQDENTDDEGEEAPTFAESPPARTSTRHYHFSYPALRSQQALALVAEADGIFERVHGLLGVPPGSSIDVDASGSATNTAGTAFFGRLRMDLGSDQHVVLAHETSHVVAERLAGEERAFLWDYATVLNEGLATWVERHFERPAPKPSFEQDPMAYFAASLMRTSRENGRLVLAALHARHELLIEELADPSRLTLLRDDNLKYPAGEALIEAIVRRHGKVALARLARAFAEPSLPTHLRGLELWQATFQLADIELAGILDEFFRDVAREAKERAEEIAGLDRPRVVLVTGGSGRFVGAVALVDREDGNPLLPIAVTLRFKPEPDSATDEYESVATVVGEPAWRRPSDIQEGRICVQAGLQLGSDQVLYEPWSCLDVSTAEAWNPTSSEAEEN